ncbi:GGDEF domain-containing protein [Agaribacter marinus]|nr:GGDEF domain-containing protein [Agaribacter marinus]
MTMCIVLLMIVALTPMLTIRLLEKNIMMVLVDAVLLSVAFLSLVFLYKEKYVAYIKGTISLTLAVGMIFSSHYGSDASMYWIFPGTLGIFSMLSPRHALALLVCMSSILLPVLVNRTSLETVLTLYATLAPSIFFVYYFARELQLRFEQLNTEAVEDYLTQAGNRRAFHRDAEHCITDLVKNAKSATLIVFDMDYFKRLNDTFGHGVGDQVLKETTSLMGKRLRRTDKIYRLGGEEFAIIVRNSNLHDGQTLAHDLREYVAVSQSDALPNYTMSFGVAELKLDESVTSWVDRADKALYASKDAGRDKISLAS